MRANKVILPLLYLVIGKEVEHLHNCHNKYCKKRIVFSVLSFSQRAHRHLKPLVRKAARLTTSSHRTSFCRGKLSDHTSSKVKAFLGDALDRFNECWNEWRIPNGRIPLYENFPRLFFVKGYSKKAVFTLLSFDNNLLSPPAPTPSQSQESVQIATTPPHTISHHLYHPQSIPNLLPFPEQPNTLFHIDNSLHVHHYHISPPKEDI